jgi:hypothetical protein
MIFAMMCFSFARVIGEAQIWVYRSDKPNDE